MSIVSRLHDQGPGSGSRAAFWQWLVIGILGIGFAFVASVHLPDQFKFPVLLPVGLGAAAGWAWGRFGRSLAVDGDRRAVVAIVWCVIAIAESLAAWKNHHDRADYLRGKWESRMNDPIATALREGLSQERENESASDRQQRLKLLADLDQADAKRLERLTFHGYPVSRMERLRVQALEQGPWPELAFALEVLLAGALGAWLALAAMHPAPQTP